MVPAEPSDAGGRIHHQRKPANEKAVMGPSPPHGFFVGSPGSRGGTLCKQTSNLRHNLSCRSGIASKNCGGSVHRTLRTMKRTGGFIPSTSVTHSAAF